MKYITTAIVSLAMLVPSVSMAAGLTQGQVDAIIGVLIAFNVDAHTITIVQNELKADGTATTTTQIQINTNQPSIIITNGATQSTPVQTAAAPAIITRMNINHFGALTSGQAGPYPDANGALYRIFTDKPIDISKTTIELCETESGNCAPADFTLDQTISITPLLENHDQGGDGLRTDFSVAPFVKPDGATIPTDGSAQYKWTFTDQDGETVTAFL